MASLILSEVSGQNIYKVYVQPGREYLLYGKVITAGAAKYSLREVNVTGQVISNTEVDIPSTDGLHEFSKVFDTSKATILLIITLTNAEVLELSLDGPQGIVHVTSPISSVLKHISQFDVLISYLDRAFEVKVSKKLNGDNRLTFNLPLDDEKGQEILNENFIECKGQKYIVKIVKDSVTNDGQKIKIIEAEHVGLGLLDYWLPDTLDMPSVSPVVALEAILADTPYTVGTVNVTGVNDLEIEIINKLKAVKTVQELWGGELYFDSYEVNLVTQMGRDNGVQFRKGKNLDKIIRTLDTNSLTTKMFGYGKDNLIIVGLDTTGWTAEQKAGLVIGEDNKISQPYLTSQYINNYAREHQGEFRDSDIDDQQKLLDAMRKAMSEQEVPKVIYETDIVNLSGLAQYVGEGFDIGDTVKVYDELINADVKARVVEYEEYPFEPWRDKAVLDNFTQNLHDYLTGLADMKDAYNKAFTGGKVSTQWLEGIINVLKNELIAETANVIITDTDGILITNGDGTKALSLKGGIFAIANSKTGSDWNWRSFGTGDGFTADLMVSGKILTSLVEIVGEAVDGANKFYWDATGLYAVDPANANRYMKFSKEGLRGYVDGVLRMHLGPYASNKFGLLLKAPDGITTVLDEDGILQTWQEGRADNTESGKPLTLFIYLPNETVSVYKAILRFRLRYFRTYSKSAASGGATSMTTPTTTTVDRTSESATWDLYSADYVSGCLLLDGSHDHDDTDYNSDHNHGIPDGTELLTASGSVWFSESGRHYHNIGHDGSHDHVLNVRHYHDITIPGHSHTFTTPNHEHNIEYGIYEESAKGTDLTVKINGVDYTSVLGGPFTTDQDSVDIKQYLTVGGWNRIELGTSNLGRIDATIFIQAKMGV